MCIASRRTPCSVHPHGRGDGLLPHRSLEVSRFTPTGVGTAYSPIGRRTCGWVHPHGRGDGRSTCRRYSRTDGSPPRAWGRPRFPIRVGGGRRFTPTGVGTAGGWPVWGVGSDVGFTPTGVGTASPDSSRTSKPWVHPHGRGDGSICLSASTRGTGSPPRAWGRLLLPDRDLAEDRFTPTGVGTAWPPRADPARAGVHPHGRGDGINLSGSLIPADGSPPRAWGRRGRDRPLPRVERFTPTGVGTAKAPDGETTMRWVHPHGRGDGVVVRAGVGRGVRSPPRAWGRPVIGMPMVRRWRFTPTGVGTASRWRRSIRSSTVHPHGRGDGENVGGFYSHGCGSPPRAWGRHEAGGDFEAGLGFTPTGVGTAFARRGTSCA